jgi:hypothetical protein
MSLLKVYGHPRSGNHLLAALLHEHLYHLDASFGATVHPRDTGHWSRRQTGAGGGAPSTFYDRGERHAGADQVTVPYAALLGSHVLRPPRHPGAALYVYRDGRDVALSVFDWVRFRRADQEALSFAQYLRAPIDWEGTPGVKAAHGEVLFAHWMRHLRSWRASGAFLVRYEDLIVKPAAVLAGVAAAFGFPTPRNVAQIHAVGWNATRGAPAQRVQKWRVQMDQTDVAYYDSLVPKDFFGRYA